MPRAVVFYMDGLIFDTEALYQQAYLDAAKLGGHEVPLDVIQLTIGMPWVRSRELMLQKLGAQFPIDHYYTQITECFIELSATGRRLKPGVLELLDVLDELGLPRCIATSSAHATVSAHLSAHELTHRFHAVIGHGDYSNSKPAPNPFLLAAERLGVPARLCVALEDSHNGVRSASAAEMMTIMVPDLVPATAEISDLCVYVAPSLHDVATLIQRAAATSDR